MQTCIFRELIQIVNVNQLKKYISKLCIPIMFSTHLLKIKPSNIYFTSCKFDGVKAMKRQFSD